MAIRQRLLHRGVANCMADGIVPVLRRRTRRHDGPIEPSAASSNCRRTRH